eukprot:327058-Alexandrium_andersonii.AAC.1
MFWGGSPVAQSRHLAGWGCAMAGGPVVQKVDPCFRAAACGREGPAPCSGRNCCLRGSGCLTVGGNIVYPPP